MQKKLYSFIILALFCIISPLSFADVVSPSTQLQTVANNMISQLENNKSHLNNFSVIRKIVNQTLIPHVDVDRMSAAVVGRYWRTATPAQQAQFEKEFSYLVTTTYSSALSSYNGDIVRFQPLRGSYATQQTATVNSMIVRKSGQRIEISYDVVRHGNDWMVYDFSIEHISMVQSYRSQFQDVLAQGGMKALLTRMQTHNQGK
ncbi:MAG: ABC transporter substrate-binding protein [Gammaproteobacteria bacterium]|nr:ABC transporter substrate-binding protein [Gammaproteobacteria bacterium]